MQKIAILILILNLAFYVKSADVASLKDAFGSKFKVGTCVSPGELNTGASFIKRHFNSITPENELKPDAIINQQACQQRGNNVNTQVVFNSGTRAILKFCQDNGIALRGHTFVWYSQTPDWFFRENFQSYGNYVNKNVMNQRLESFIKNTFALLAQDYPNLKVYAYDVCNELFVNNGGGLRPASNSKWMQVYGDDSFIINAFTYARKYAPSGCKLFINDYNEYMTAKTNDIYNMALKLKQKGIIDGIGMQSHVGVNFPSFQDYKKALEKFLSTGLEVHISELDIAYENNFNAQATYFKNVFQLAVDKAGPGKVTCLTVWGTNDGNSWISDKKALLFSSGYSPKQAYYSVMEVAKNLPSGGSNNNNNNNNQNTNTNLPSGTKYVIVNRLSGKAVGVYWDLTDDGTNVHQWSINGKTSEEWICTKMSDGYKFTNVNANKCLEVYNMSKENSGNIVIWPDTGVSNQRWEIQDAGEGYVFLKNVYSGLYLDVEKKSMEDGGNIIQYQFNGNGNQQWKLVPA
ncbi:MAG: endo-1,4-beta-xylanase [Clostridia bacterium]|nr:endo-1,4-beta-xylanase [Clostridia bacterium]